jgi:hypothetical protein
MVVDATSNQLPIDMGSALNLTKGSGSLPRMDAEGKSKCAILSNTFNRMQSGSLSVIIRETC